MHSCVRYLHVVTLLCSCRQQDALNPLRKAAESMLRVSGKDNKRRNATGAIEVITHTLSSFLLSISGVDPSSVVV